MLSKWSGNLSELPKTSSLSTLASQIIWYNKHNLIDKRSFYNTNLADKVINHVGQLSDTTVAMKPRSVFKKGFSFSKNSHFYWIQLNNAIPKVCKRQNFCDLTFSRLHIIKKY